MYHMRPDMEKRRRREEEKREEEEKGRREKRRRKGEERRGGGEKKRREKRRRREGGEERRGGRKRGGGEGREKRRCTICHMPSGPLGSPKMAHAPGRGMAPFCRRRTIPGCPDAYRRCCARSNPRLMRCAPPRRTAACARRPPRTARSGLDLRRDIVQKRGLLPLSTHQPPLTPLKRPTLPTAQGLAQAEKPNPACKAASPAPSLKPSAAHGQIGRSSAEFARGGSSDQPRPQWAFGSDESTHQLSSIAQFYAMAAAAFTVSQRSHIKTHLQGHNRSNDHELLL